MTARGPDKWQAPTAEEERLAVPIKRLGLTFFLNSLVLGWVFFAYSFEHVSTYRPSACGMALDLLGGTPDWSTFSFIEGAPFRETACAGPPDASGLRQCRSTARPSRCCRG